MKQRHTVLNRSRLWLKWRKNRFLSKGRLRSLGLKQHTGDKVYCFKLSIFIISKKVFDLLNKERVISEIQNVGLYSLVLQDVEKLIGKEHPSRAEVAEALEKDPRILRDYMQTTVEYNLSNIHLQNIDTDKLSPECRETAKKINTNLDKLREIEKYTLDFEQSSTLVLIFSVEFFVLFSVQYFIVLLDLKAYQWWIYSFFALSIVAAWLYARKERKKYARNNKLYEEKYEETLRLIDTLEKQGCLRKEDLYIAESDEHI